MSQWNLSGLVVGFVAGFVALSIVMLVSRPRGLQHPSSFHMIAIAMSIGPVLTYLTFDVDAVTAAISRREIETGTQLFWVSFGLAYLSAGLIAMVASAIAGIVRARRR